jgi:hypothetical protein
MLIAAVLGTSLLSGCGSDESKAPGIEEVKEQFFQGNEIGFKTDVPAEVTTRLDKFAAMSNGRWSPEDDHARALEDSLTLIKASGFEAGAARKYTAPGGEPQFVFGAVMAVEDAADTLVEVAARVKAMAIHPCPWACVKESVPLELPADGGAVGYSVLREVRPGGTPESAVNVRQVYGTWASGDHVHLALLFDDAEGRNIEPFMSFIADEIRRTAAL